MKTEHHHSSAEIVTFDRSGRRPREQFPSFLLAAGLALPEQYQLFEDLQSPLRFAIRRHRATRLHTDYRFEVGKELLSWASYTRPTLDPGSVNELREMCEHKARYLESERRIPDGDPGAGATMVWDFGPYWPMNVRGSSAHRVVEELRRGRLDVWLEGKRLRGGFRFELMGRGWRFTKLHDEYAISGSKPEPDVSVVSGRTLAEIEAEYQAQQRSMRSLRTA